MLFICTEGEVRKTLKDLHPKLNYRKRKDTIGFFGQYKEIEMNHNH